jgi:hypothetical protein
MLLPNEPCPLSEQCPGLKEEQRAMHLVFGFWVSHALTQRAMPAFRAMPWFERRTEGYALVFEFWVSYALTQRAMPAFRAMLWSERELRAMLSCLDFG